MPNEHAASRRCFLRRCAAALAFRPELMARAPLPGPSSADALYLARLKLDREFYETHQVVNGELYFRREPRGPVTVRWVDGAGRTAEEVALPPVTSTADAMRFTLPLTNGLTYVNWIEVFVNATKQMEQAKFLLSPPVGAWDDFHTIVWASYPEGFYGLLSEIGIDSTIAYHDNDFSPVVDNNFRLFVEQMAPDVFALYHNNQNLWRSLIQDFQNDRDNWKLLIRKPCVNDPNTDEYLRRRLTRTVREHRAFRPLYYNIADELGHGDQIQPIDFCHSPHCTARFAEYLRDRYGSTDRVAAEWGGREAGRWDDEILKSGSDWRHEDLMIARTTTDRAFDLIAAASLAAKHGSIIRLNKEWNASFPAPASEESRSSEQWEPLLAAVRESRSIATLDAKSLEQKLGSIEAANARWGRFGGWTTEGRPAGFKSWDQVVQFLKRFYAELGQVSSTDGWNVSPWCDFRNFMDATFAGAVQRAAAVCKAEDPEARCATEGGQAPAAFGWYNYEQVTKAVDVIEPYNIGNNVEVLRSLKPDIVLLATHGSAHHSGRPLTAQDRLSQKAVGRALWWQLFHGHRGAIIWDDNLPTFEVVDVKAGKPTPSADAFRDVFKELRGGIAKLIINSRRLHDGIGLHYSHASIQVHWLLENLKNARDWPSHHVNERGSRFVAVRNSWTKLLEDLGFQYDFVSRQPIEAGKLGSREFRVFILPESIAVSEAEANAFREFVRAGGTLIADCRAGRLSERGRDLGRSLLDDAFGIKRGPAEKATSTVEGYENDDALRVAGMKLQFARVGESFVKVDGGRALARSGDVPAVIVNRLGAGRAIFLNLDVSDYAYQRLQANLEPTLPDLLRAVLAQAQISGRVEVLGPDGKRLRCTEVVAFGNGAYEHVAVFRNPQFDDGGWGDHPTIPAGEWAGQIDNSVVEKPEDVSVEWRDARPTYDVRGRKEFGEVKTVRATLDPWSPLVFTRAAAPIPDLRVSLPAQVRAGQPLELNLQTDRFPGGGVRVVRTEVFTPSGELYELYGKNVVLRPSPHAAHIPLAYDDPKGQWRLMCHDLVSGQVINQSFEVV